MYLQATSIDRLDADHTLRLQQPHSTPPRPPAPVAPRLPAPATAPLRAFCAGKALRSVARLLVHRDVARGWRSWIALTATHQRPALRAER